MNKRSDHLARVSRKVLPTEELFVTSLEGKKLMKTKWCSYHKRYEPVGDFYYESKSKATKANQLRKMCAIAWDITNGKTFIDRERSTASLMLFI